MGKYDREIEHSQKMLAEAEEKYKEAQINMASSAPAVREFVLGTYRDEMTEAKNMIDTFEQAND